MIEAASIGGNGAVTRYGYDAADRLQTVTDPIGNVTTYGYDALSRRISTSNLAIQSNPLVSQTFTPDGRVGTILIARNNTAPDVTTYGYDGFDRLGSTTYPNGGSGATSEALTYDADSNVVTRTTRKGDVIAFAYDTLNRVCTKAYAATAIACGGTSAGYLVSYAYDLDGRLIAANDNGAAVTLPSASASFSQTASFDALNRPVALSWSPAAAQTTPASSSSVTFTHGYDPDNRRISQAVNDNSWLQYPGPSSSSTAYTANALNQYTAVGAASRTYDANGNLTYDGTFTYAYDAESRLTSITQGATTVATYAYDAQGRRKSKTVGTAVTAYVTDADNREILEVNGTSGALQTWYAYGSGPNDVLNQVNIAAGTRSTLIPDLQGSVIAALSSGGALTKVGYLPFGESTGTSTASNGFFFTGGRLDPETVGSASQPSGLYYLRAREYCTAWGRFCQPDPTGYGAGPNLYTYALNNPLSLMDPFGLTADAPGGSSGLLNGQCCLIKTGGPEDDEESAKRGFLEDFLDPLAEVRQEQFNSTLNAIRQLDPNNRELTYASAPGWTPDSSTISRVTTALDNTRQQVVSDISAHAFDSHAGEFGITNQADFENLASDTISRQNGQSIPTGAPGRVLFYNPSNGAAVIVNTQYPTQSTMFRTSQRYVSSLLKPGP